MLSLNFSIDNHPISLKENVNPQTSDKSDHCENALAILAGVCARSGPSVNDPFSTRKFVPYKPSSPKQTNISCKPLLPIQSPPQQKTTEPVTLVPAARTRYFQMGQKSEHLAKRGIFLPDSLHQQALKIIDVCAAYFEITKEQLHSGGKAPFTDAQRMAIYICKNLLQLTESPLAYIFNLKVSNCSMAIYHINQKKDKWANDIDTLQKMIEGTLPLTTVRPANSSDAKIKKIMQVCANYLNITMDQLKISGNSLSYQRYLTIYICSKNVKITHIALSKFFNLSSTSIRKAILYIDHNKNKASEDIAKITEILASKAENPTP